MPRADALRRSQLRPTTTGARVAAVAAGLALVSAVGTGVNMLLLTGNRAFAAAALVAFVYTFRMLLMAAAALALAALAWRRGAALAAVLLVPTAVVLAAISVVPVNAQWGRARDYGVDLSVRELLHPTLGRGSLTGHRDVATTDGGSVGLDVWDVAGRPAGPRPAVVLLHGGSWTTGAPGGTPAWNRELPDLGFVVLDVDYRVPSDVPGGWRPELQVGDVKCAIGWARDHAAELGIDPGRISAMGHSSGGDLALLAGYAAADPAMPATCAVGDASVRSIVNLYGPTDLRGLWDRSPAADELRPALRTYLGASPDEVPDRYDRFSPIRHVRADVPPTASIIGESDQLVPVGQVRDLGDALARAGAAHEEWYLPGTDHLFDLSWGAFNTQIARAKVAAFLARHG